MPNTFNYKKLSLLILLSLSANAPHYVIAAPIKVSIQNGQNHKFTNDEFSSISIGRENTSADFYADEVSVAAPYTGVNVFKGGRATFHNNLNITGAPNQVTSHNLAVTDKSSVLVKGNLNITGQGEWAPHVKIDYDSTLTVWGDLNIHHTARKSKHDAQLITLTHADSRLHVRGNTTLINDGGNNGISLQSGAQATFDGNFSLTQHAAALTVGDNSSFVVKGDTDISLSDPIQTEDPAGNGLIRRGAHAVNAHGTSLISLGYINKETQAELNTNRATHAQVYVGQNAKISVLATDHYSDSIALRLRADTASLVIVDGLLSAKAILSEGGGLADQRKAWSIFSEGNTADTVKVRQGGNLLGMVNLGNGDDALYVNAGSKGGIDGDIYTGNGNDKVVVTSGHIKGDIYFYDYQTVNNINPGGDDYFDFVGGKITGRVLMGGYGHDKAFIRQGADISELYHLDGGASIGNDPDPSSTGEITFEGQTFRAYSGYHDNREDGLRLSAWNTISLNKGSELTLTGKGLFDSQRTGTLNIDASSTLKLADINNNKIVEGHVNNSGAINLANKNAGETLNIAGNYTGNDGLIIMDVQLGEDNSPTDKLDITGDTSGTTLVRINNIGGTGALTDKGIELIKVGGASDGTFKQDGRIVAGAYDYFLNRGNTARGADAKNWYLTSELPPSPPPEPQEPIIPPPCDCVLPPPLPPVTPKPPVPAPIVRPETGSYITNIATANRLFITRLHDRLGDTQYTDILTGEKKVTSLWLRQVGGHNRARDSSGQLKTQSNRYVVQLGGDIADWSHNGLDRWHLGLMAGYGNSQSNTDSRVTGYTSRGTVSGYSAGIYGTWYANDEDKNGTYIDTWALYSWFKNTVKGDGLNSEKYNSQGVTASIEAGYTFNLGQYDERTRYFLQPKAQVIWMGIGADDHTEHNGTTITSTGKNNIQTRLGLRAYLSGHSTIDDGKDRTFEPFVEANWIHNTKNMGATMNGVSHTQVGDDDIAELKTGIEAQFNQKLTGWINVAQQIGTEGYSDTSATLGMKYSF
ncbi:autotransporter outer membrane beta-barrel domain-containing protein [Pragia fontium]|uniref:autotransporter outer membrane beta-barrel domain-containing protein n=1 Tax=Pragia fontium TaxID=82985 RepID=UPI0006995F35|nr:autotransporter outer membrane beta-barrel domain-containing protein [Pragia fontium]